MSTKILKYLASIFLTPFKYFIPKDDIVLLCAHDRYHYSGNTKYLYEYLHHNSKYSIYWITDHPAIMEYLDRMNMAYISTKYPLKMIWVLLRAKVTIDSGTSFFNPFGILGNDRVIKITTSHGNGPKSTLSRFHPPDDSRIAIKQLANLYLFDYLNYPSRYSETMVAKRMHLLPNENIINLGYPRCDHYFNKAFVNKSYKKKLIAKSLNNLLRDDSKIILYTPTWRPYDYEFPLSLMKGIDLIDLNTFLQSKNCFLFFTVHSAHLPKDEIEEMSHIIFIDTSKYPFFDINEFMMEVDILLNDYSTTSTEFAILGRPQLFFMPDYDYYREEKGFVEEYKDILPGEEIHDFIEFKSIIDIILDDQQAYTEKFHNKYNELLDKYYDVKKYNSSELFHSFIEKVTNRS